MKFSVIIPVYKAENTLPRCLNSLLTQPHDDAEIIVVNDGSPDNCNEICKKYTEEYACIKYFEKENGGVSTARNLGLDKAKGEYILFVDSDDYVSNDYFSTLRDRVAGNEDMVLFAYNRVDNDKTTPLCDKQSALNEKSTFEKINHIVYERKCSPWNKCYKNELIKNCDVRFPEDLYIGEDFIFGLRFMLNCKSINITDDLLYYVDETSDSSLTRTIRDDRYLQSLRIYEYAFSYVEESQLESDSKSELLQTLDYIYCRTAFACIKYALIGKKANYSECSSTIHEILQAFKTSRPKWYKAKSLIHSIMHTTIKYNMKALAFLVAKI